MRRSSLFGGLLIRRERWSLSFMGRLCITLILAGAAFTFSCGVHSFLAVNDGGSGEVMVVEGWIGSRPLDQAAAAFRQGHYQFVVVVRDVYNTESKWTSDRYSADYVAADLVEHGVPKDQVHTLFCPVVQKDRTYHCAVAVRQWLQEQGNPVKSLDVVTVACHSRRSRLLYRNAFGSKVTVGAISLAALDYNPQRWWRTSEGVREVPFEFLAYLYAKLFFSP